MKRLKNKQNLHLIHHTHWDREWYYTSEHSKMMTYWDMKYMIDFLIKNDKVKFSYDGQTSVVDDFLEYAPEWKEKLKKVIKSKQLLVGPWYTQTDNLQPVGESIVRNLEIGGKIAQDMGHRMNVGYLPDSFGHNPQTPQIMRLVGINNFTFYRGLDPKKVDSNLYFNYIAPSGDSVLGIWQTHYFTKPNILEYKEYMKHAFKDKGTSIEVTAKSYEKRSNGLPIWTTIGADMEPFSTKLEKLEKDLNKKNGYFNYMISDYETLVNDVLKNIKDKEVELVDYKGELREAFTGRVHRSIMSARMDIKQQLAYLENKIINNIEPLAVVCERSGIDVPWKMIEKVWKDIFKSSAHDSYGGCVEDIAYRKLRQRLDNAIIVADGVSSMLSKLNVSQTNEIKNDKKSLYLFNVKKEEFSGYYEIEISLDKQNDKKHAFKIFDKKHEIPYFIYEVKDKVSHDRSTYKILLFANNIKAFSFKKFEIKYIKKTSNNVSVKNTIENDFYSINIENNKINLFNKNNKKLLNDVIKICADASAGDTYDHSPITWKDKKYWFNNFQIIKTIENGDLKIMELKSELLIPNGLDEWKSNKASILQDVKLLIILNNNELNFKLKVLNKSDNCRLRLMVNSGKEVDKWEHDMQFCTYERKVKNDYMDNWNQKDINKDVWQEYPTNLSPHQNFINVKDNQVAVITNGTKEHEVINEKNKAYVAITLYRAIDKFSRGFFPYRPGRPSGLPSDAPEAQLKNQELEFNFKIISGEYSNFDLYKHAEQFHSKPSFIDGSWTVENTIVKFNTNYDYYTSNKKLDALKIGEELKQKGLISKALYKDVNGNTILRLLNVSESPISFLKSYKHNFVIKDQIKNNIFELKPWKLVNIYL